MTKHPSPRQGMITNQNLSRTSLEKLWRFMLRWPPEQQARWQLSELRYLGLSEQFYISGNLHAAARKQKNPCATTIFCRLPLFWSGP